MVPTSLLAILSCLIESRRHERLPLLINTAKDVVEILDASQIPVDFVGNIVGAITALVGETQYESTTFPFNTDIRIRTRIACGGLARSLKRIVPDAEEVQNCVDVLAQDVFAEVRRETE